MAEGIGAGVQESVYVGFETSSLTTAIAVGQLVELDASGDIILCSAAVTIKMIGVAASGVATRTVASQELISVQVAGVARVYTMYDSAGTYTTAIVPGERLMVGEDSPSAYDGQVLVHATAAAGTTSDFNTDFRKPVAIALEANSSVAATTPVVKKVLLTL